MWSATSTASGTFVPAVRSIYVWKGKVEDDEESMMLFKTTEALVAALTDRIRALHSYEVPEIIAIEIKEDEGNPDYLSWVRTSVAENSTG